VPIYDASICVVTEAQVPFEARQTLRASSGGFDVAT